MTALAPTAAAVRDPRRAYRVVDDFEAELAAYTDAPYAVTVDSCTNALLLALTLRPTAEVWLPRHTYVGVLQAARNAGCSVELPHQDWQQIGFYQLEPTPVWDSARRIEQGHYDNFPEGSLVCLSFNAGKQLALGHGGAILTDDHHTVEWLQRARADGRAPGNPEPYATFPGFHCPLDPPTAALGLWTLSRWADAGWSPPPLPIEDYPDLSELAWH